MVASMMSQSGEFDEVWLMPGRLNPLKVNDEPPVSFAHRAAMAEIVARDCPGVRVCDVENELPIPSYTITTLRELNRRWPEHSFRLIIGSDNWQRMERWREPETIIRDYGVIIYERPGYPLEGNLPAGVSVAHDMPQMLISSTFLRKGFAKGMDLRYLVPEGVLRYISEYGLYK